MQVLVDSVIFGHDLSTAIRRGRLHVPAPSSSSAPEVLVEGADDGELALSPAAVAEAFGRGGQVGELPLPYTTVDGVDKVKDRPLPVADPRAGGTGEEEGNTESRLQ